MFEIAVAIIVLLILGGAFLLVLFKISLRGILSVATFIFKMFCVFFGVMAGVIFLLLQKAIPFLVKHLSTAILWIISTIISFALAVYALSRKILHGESFTEFMAQLIPNKDLLHGKDFSLSAIAIIDAIHSEIISKLEMHYQKIFRFF